MIKQFTFSLLLLFVGFVLSAQEPDESVLGPCGAPPGIHPWLLDWHERPGEFPARTADPLYVGIQVHLLARDNGTGRFRPEFLLDAFCRLNADFAGSEIRFYFKNEWNLIDNGDWHTHATIPEGIDMMLTNNVPDALNTYFVSDPAGNCGYNLPYAGIAIAHGCADPDQHTWAHEIGHALALPHPFIGWESQVYNFAVPTPEQLTYDYTYFHDSLETTVPAPLDTALVERLDGSNCGIAADLICDTRPDYLSHRWACDDQQESLVTLKDQTGATFKADGTLFMSYAGDVCSNRFSDEEITVMRANLLTEKLSWLHPGPPEADVNGLPELLSPIGGAAVAASGVTLHWSAAPGATHYLVQGSRFSTFLAKQFETVVSDTTFTTAALLADYTYYWRVRPFNDWYSCTDFTSSATFQALSTSAVSQQTAADGFRCYPSRLAPGQALTLDLPVAWQKQSADYQVFDATGRLLWQAELSAGGPRMLLHLPSGHWPAGVYHLLLRQSEGVKTVSFVLSDF